MRTISHWFMEGLIRHGTDILCRIDKDDFHKVPRRGPLILVTNHTGSLEVPLLFVHLQPRRMIGLAKIETWDNKFMGWLFDLWEAIPVRRGEADLDAIRKCLAVLEGGDILAIAPEGTRSNHGRLLCAQPGVALVALRAGVPILPIAHWGGENFGENLRKFKRTDFHVRVGRPFRLDAHGGKVTGDLRQAMADEIMGQIAALLPEEYHGEYAGRAGECKYLQFLDQP
jgi:1-acyl-sn-glycerol-3-phosphate acyltransferase